MYVPEELRGNSTTHRSSTALAPIGHEHLGLATQIEPTQVNASNYLKPKMPIVLIKILPQVNTTMKLPMQSKLANTAIERGGNTAIERGGVERALAFSCLCPSRGDLTKICRDSVEPRSSRRAPEKAQHPGKPRMVWGFRFGIGPGCKQTKAMRRILGLWVAVCPGCSVTYRQKGCIELIS